MGRTVEGDHRSEQEHAWSEPGAQSEGCECRFEWIWMEDWISGDDDVAHTIPRR